MLEQVLVRALSVRVDLPCESRPETTEAFRRLTALDGRLDVATLAEEIGWSRRHLAGQFTAEYGVEAEEMARVLHFERSKNMLVRADRHSLATIAAECGYADRAHMAREWRALAGSSPTRWLADERLPFVQDDDPGDPAPSMT